MIRKYRPSDFYLHIYQQVTDLQGAGSSFQRWPNPCSCLKMGPVVLLVTANRGFSYLLLKYLPVTPVCFTGRGAGCDSEYVIASGLKCSKTKGAFAEAHCSEGFSDGADSARLSCHALCGRKGLHPHMCRSPNLLCLGIPLLSHKSTPSCCLIKK